ncbi:hypothetical protein [Vibrio scophthalmi]|uniref:Uncharacterized protein n=1 Tax=Vibrio scophthalmi TaxID=45658 RepID=A0A1C7F6S3_9VIBR|nr:hypothetical protein [Vibrio scophthalmi]ANU35656.1 hypothetical protein VSVS05_00523 [Vibrio scophthalmi]
MNVDYFNFSEKFLLISLLSKHGCEFDFSERIDRFSERYNVSSNNVTSLFSKLTKSGFLEKERRYPEKDKAKYRYCFKASLAGWFYEQSVLGVRNDVRDLKFFLREMEARYPNANRTIPADQRWFLLILIAHQDEFGTVTHLTIKDLCYLMGGIREERFKRIQKKSVDAGLISVLKTSATFFHEVKNVYLLKGSKGIKVGEVKSSEIKSSSVPYIPSSYELFHKLYVNNFGYLSKEKVYSRVVFSWQENIASYKHSVPKEIDGLLRKVPLVRYGGIKLLYDKYLNSSSTDTSELMQVKLNRLATLIINEYSDEINFEDEQSMEVLLNKLSNDKKILYFLKWDNLLSKGMLNTIGKIPDASLEKLQKKSINLSKPIDYTSLSNEESSVLSLYFGTVQGMIAFSLCIAQQCKQFLNEHGGAVQGKYQHTIDANLYVSKALPMVKLREHILLTIHSYTSSNQDQEYFHTIKHQGREGKNKGKFIYECSVIESTLIT